MRLITVEQKEHSTREDIMKAIISLAVVVAFFVAVPQCLGQSQDTEKDAAQLLTEQQLVQMFKMAMVQGRPEAQICHVDPKSPSPGVGRIVLVNEKSVQAHLRHGDCEDYVANNLDEPGKPCECLCPGTGQVQPCET